MKKTISIFLLVILLIQTGGLLVIFKIEQSYIKGKMHVALNNSKTRFRKITLSLSDYQKNNINTEEIIVDGKMYDIKSITITDNKVELLVIHDIDEENIIEKITRTANQDKATKGNLVCKLRKFVSLNYLSTNQPATPQIVKSSNNIFYCNHSKLVSTVADISNPPPQ